MDLENIEAKTALDEPEKKVKAEVKKEKDSPQPVKKPVTRTYTAKKDCSWWPDDTTEVVLVKGTAITGLSQEQLDYLEFHGFIE